MATNETPGTAATNSAGASSFGQRLAAAMDAYGPLCAGIDPHRSLVQDWGLTYDLAGVERFAMTCVEALGGEVAAIKPQSAFFEVFGSPGIALLERVIDAARDLGSLVILDVKRGDIGSTMEAYGEAFLGPHAPSPPDAITLSPYLGYESLRPAIDLAAEHSRGVFALCLTSNPEGASVQHAVRDGESVAAAMARSAAGDNAAAREQGHLGSVGLVVGATVGTAVQDLGVDLAAMGGPVLAPGIGAQGATLDDVRAVFGAALPQVLASSSRSILRSGPQVAKLRAAAHQEAALLRALRDPDALP
ncbi:MAG: orotidine-5'-phosphate decarboxylase [Actinomycetia bacterium]|nr:orotidine-5'-phosphate decarboxylase [Actinomycetes bacterium]